MFLRNVALLSADYMELNSRKYDSLWIFYLCSFLHPFVISSPSGSDILRSILFSNAPILRDDVSHPYKTTGKIIIFTFRQQTGRKDILM
jgi:hypothetical protein